MKVKITKCPNCEGKGEYELNTWGNPIIKCEQCNGTGKIINKEN